MKLFVLLISKC